jgi:serine/threonine protein kinase
VLSMRGLLEGVKYLSSMNVMHRDLKPDNILWKFKRSQMNLCYNTIKIVDFGLSQHAG